MTEIKKGKFPENFYRVSIKACVENEKGEFLMVNENGKGWGLPGGGMDFADGGDVMTTLRRELKEELGIENELEIEFWKIETGYKEIEGVGGFWKMCVLYRVKILGEYEAKFGEDVSDMAWLPMERVEDF